MAAAIELADAEGLGALSMRRVAERLGVGTMSLYTYVPGKAELLDVMLDTVLAEVARPDGARGWRAGLELRRPGGLGAVPPPPLDPPDLPGAGAARAQRDRAVRGQP